MYDAYQEHLDHEAGRASDLQNAYALSQMTRKPDDGDKIANVMSYGRYALVCEHSEYCRHTDALLGSRRTLMGEFEDREAAFAALCEQVDKYGVDDAYWYILPRAPEAKREPVVDDGSIPF